MGAASFGNTDMSEFAAHFSQHLAKVEGQAPADQTPAPTIATDKPAPANPAPAVSGPSIKP